MSNSIIQAKEIWKTYKNAGQELQVLKGVDLSVDEGEMLAIVGPSGAGKSTLLHILGGLDRPSEGEVKMNGQDLYEQSDVALAKIRNTELGFIFQFYHLLPDLNALDNVVIPALIKGEGNKEENEERGRKLLEQVGLRDRWHHRPNQLSGGEQQRVAIARALMNLPKVILCDEPTGNLDSKNGNAIIDLLMDLNQKSKQTLVIVTHDQNIASRAQRVVTIKDGTLGEN